MTIAERKTISRISKTISSSSSKKAIETDSLLKDIDSQLESVKNNVILIKTRSFLGAGAQSVAIDNGHKKILLVTPLSAAKGIEHVKKAFAKLSATEKQNLPFELPTLVGRNKPLRELMNFATERELKNARVTYLANITPKIINGNENVIYELTRYDGTLEDFRVQKKIRFKHDSIDQIQQRISSALNILHKENIAHGDIAFRNIFYTGTYPHFKFYLGDFGSVKPVSADKNIPLEFEKDKHNLNVIINKLQKQLTDCPPSPIKGKKELLTQYNANTSRTRSKINSNEISLTSRAKLSF